MVICLLDLKLPKGRERKWFGCLRVLTWNLLEMLLKVRTFIVYSATALILGRKCVSSTFYISCGIVPISSLTHQIHSTVKNNAMYWNNLLASFSRQMRKPRFQSPRTVIPSFWPMETNTPFLIDLFAMILNSIVSCIRTVAYRMFPIFPQFQVALPAFQRTPFAIMNQREESGKQSLTQWLQDNYIMWAAPKKRVCFFLLV